MSNAYRTLGIPERLAIGGAELAAAFREAGAKVHPDAGGADEEFASLRKAMDILASPSKRLRHWLELRGCEIDPRGAVDHALMDLFAEVGGVTQRAEEVVRKRAATRSALALAMLEAPAQACREEVEASVARVEHAISREMAGFAALESAEEVDADKLSRTIRNLAFLEKWKASLRAAYSRLV